MPVYHLQPQDLLFFRDARPMEPQSPGGGHGAGWPHPAVLFDALHAALWRAFPDAPVREATGFSHHSFYVKKDGQRQPIGQQRTWFHTLATAGPFPVLAGQWLFPAPADALPDGGRLLPITEEPGASNLPKPLKYPTGATSLGGKADAARWWTKAALEQWLRNPQAPLAAGIFKADALFDNEWTTGIGTDPLTETQDGERIYSAQYLRLREQVRLGLWASLLLNDGVEGLDRLFPSDRDAHVILAGGQQRACRVEPQRDTDLATLLPVSAPIPADCTRLKWTLLSPAVFPAVPKQEKDPGGWLPTWIHPKSRS